MVPVPILVSPSRSIAVEVEPKTKEVVEEEPKEREVALVVPMLRAPAPLVSIEEPGATLTLPLAKTWNLAEAVEVPPQKKSRVVLTGERPLLARLQ